MQGEVLPGSDCLQFIEDQSQLMVSFCLVFVFPCWVHVCSAGANATSQAIDCTLSGDKWSVSPQDNLELRCSTSLAQVQES